MESRIKPAAAASFAAMGEYTRAFTAEEARTIEADVKPTTCVSQFELSM